MRKDINVNYSCNWDSKPILISCDIFFIFVKTSQIANWCKIAKKIWSVIYFFAQNWALKIAGMTHIFEQFFSCNSRLVDTCLNYTVVWTIVRLNYCLFQLLTYILFKILGFHDQFLGQTIKDIIQTKKFFKWIYKNRSNEHKN